MNDISRRFADFFICEAVALGKAIDAKVVIPCHYNMFEFNTADVNDFVREAEKINQPYKVLGGGERVSIFE